VFESSEQVSVVRLAASCSVFIGRSGGAYHVSWNGPPMMGESWVCRLSRKEKYCIEDVE